MAVKSRGEYPEEWRRGEIQKAAKDRAKWSCEHCGLVFPVGKNTTWERLVKGGGPTVLTVHHLDGDRSNCTYENLLVCCQHCHLHIQAVWSPGDVMPWAIVPRWVKDRGLTYIQLDRLEGF